MDKDERIAVLEKALSQIRDRAIQLRLGTDDWFELVEFELCASNALNNKN